MESKQVANCSFCEKPGATASCGGCGLLFYCSKECQSSHWKQSHKNTCPKNKNSPTKIQQTPLPQTQATSVSNYIQERLLSEKLPPKELVRKMKELGKMSSPFEPTDSNQFFVNAMKQKDFMQMKRAIGFGANPNFSFLQNPNFPPAGNISLVHLATALGDLEILHFLEEVEADFDSQDYNWCEPPLHIALRYQKMPIINFLIPLTKDLNRPSKAGNTALHIAAQLGQVDIVKLLISKGVNPLMSSHLGTPAQATEHPEIKKMLEDYANSQPFETVYTDSIFDEIQPNNFFEGLQDIVKSPPRKEARGQSENSSSLKIFRYFAILVVGFLYVALIYSFLQHQTIPDQEL